MEILEELLRLAALVLDVCKVYRQVHDHNERHALPQLREKMKHMEVLAETAVLLDSGPTVLEDK